MEFLSNIELGVSVAFSITNILYCLLGVTVGTAIGVLPGVGPVVTIAILLPLTYGVPPASALIMLAGIYYGAQYGGSTTAILVNLPGESSSVVTCIDGNKMAKQGRGGAALTVAALASFFAGTVGTILLAVTGPALASVALSFRSPEYFSIMVLALVMSSALMDGSMAKGMLMALFGMLVGILGTDLNSGVSRFTFGLPELADGIEFSIAAVGLFAFSEVMLQLEEKETAVGPIEKINRYTPTREEFKASVWPAIRGTAVGSFLGFLPGVGAVISSFASYTLEKRISRTPDRFGQGAVEGVAAPEAANNASAQCSFIPTLTLGLPGSATMALMLGALMLQNITPGPEVISKHPDLFWGLVVSMWFGNLLLVVLNLPLVGIWVRLLSTPYNWLFPAIIVFSCIGVFGVNNSAFAVGIAATFGVIGYVLRKLEFPLAPLALGLVLGPMLEENLKRSLIVSRGDLTVFFSSPISAILMSLSILMIALMGVQAFKKKYRAAVAADPNSIV